MRYFLAFNKFLHSTNHLQSWTEVELILLSTAHTRGSSLCILAKLAISSTLGKKKGISQLRGVCSCSCWYWQKLGKFCIHPYQLGWNLTYISYSFSLPKFSHQNFQFWQMCRTFALWSKLAILSTLGKKQFLS